MPHQFTVSTDKKEKIKLESGIIEASWVPPIAYGGFEANFTVKTVFVAEGSTIEIKGRSTKGKAPDTVKGKIFNNSFKGSLLIPEKVAPDAEIWFEAKLPKHGLSMESNTIPARPIIGVKKLCWDRKEVIRNDIVTLTCQFDDGVLDGEEALLVIYEYNPDSCDIKLVSIPAVIIGSKAEIKWEFDYPVDTALIPTNAEKQKNGKKYVNPAYYFVVSVNGQRAGVNRESGLLTFRDGITITVQHGNIATRDDQAYTITFADGSTIVKKADNNNKITIDKAPPGEFTILPEKRPAYDIVTGKTGTPLLAIFPDVNLLVDAHMHIQSNNCCPLPLQWALVAESVGFLKGRPSGDDRKALNKTAAVDIENLGDLLIAPIIAWNVRRLGKIGRLSTDMIGKLYYEKLYDNDMRHEMCWTILSDNEIKKHGANQEEMRKIAGRKAKLSALTAKSSEKYDEEFIEKTRYYFEGNRIRRMGIALLMDLSFGSFWGRFGLPLYLSPGNSMVYINDFASVVISQLQDSNTAHVKLDNSVVTPKISISPLFGNVNPSDTIWSRIHLFPSFSSRESERFLSSPSLYSEQFDLFTHGNSSTKAPPFIKFEGTANVQSMLSRKYVHFVDHAPGEDAARFEDYAVQRERSIAASIMNPLSLFTFYHYDPRRHCLSARLSTEGVAKNILAEHAFFTVKQNEKSSTDRNHLRYHGCIDATEQAPLNDPASLAALLAEHLRSNTDALAELHLHDPAGQGMFWGVKMYPRLGYAPSDFVHYPNLMEFYAACEAKSIPITAHCGPGGMSIADYFLYERYDEGRYLDIKEKDGCYSLKHAAERFDGVTAGTKGQDSPSRWEEVLKKYPKLKLNLAHFGSSDTWKECAGFGKMDKELSDDKDTGKNYKKHHRYRDWTKKIAELVHGFDNVYTDISYFINDDPSWFFGVGHDRDDIAEDLVYLLKKYPSLKDRLLMGSDWYMIEKDGEEGIGDYLRKMFYMLRSVSKEMGFDAWHQFSVVNPLRFLGLIDGKKGSAGPFTVDTEMLEGLKGKFEGRLGKKDWKEDNGCTITDSDFQINFAEMLSLLKNITIPAGDKILRNNKLAIIPPD